MLKRKPKVKIFRMLKIVKTIIIWSFCSFIPRSYAEDSTKTAAFTVSAAMAVTVATLDSVNAYYAYDTQKEVSDSRSKPPLICSTVLHAVSAALLGMAGVAAFTGKKGPNIALVLSLLSWGAAIGGSVANFVAYGYENRKGSVAFGLSVSTVFANFFPVMGYFFTRAFIDPGIREPMK